MTDRELVHVPLEHALQVQLLQLPLQSRGQAGVHGGAARQHNVFVELGPGGQTDRQTVSQLHALQQYKHEDGLTETPQDGETDRARGESRKQGEILQLRIRRGWLLCSISASEPGVNVSI